MARLFPRVFSLFSLVACLLNTGVANAQIVHFFFPQSIAAEPNGNLLVTATIDNVFHVAANGIVRINPATGAQSILLQDLIRSSHVAVAGDGSIYVVDVPADTGGGNRILQINPLNGASRVVVNGGIFGNAGLGGLAVDTNGDILAVTGGQIIRTNPVTGAQTIDYANSALRLRSLVVESDGKLLTVNRMDSGTTQILRIDLATRVATVVSSGGHLNNVNGISRDSSGNIYASGGGDPLFTQFGYKREIVRVDPISGAQTVLTSGGLLTENTAVTISGGTIYVLDPAANGGTPQPNVLGDGAVFGFDLATAHQVFTALGSRFPSNTLPVVIKIKPPADNPKINLAQQGMLPVAITANMGSDVPPFDVTRVDPTTVRFGTTGSEAAPVRAVLADVDNDGRLDLILHFETQKAGFQCNSNKAFLTGTTFSGQLILGVQSVEMICH